MADFRALDDDLAAERALGIRVLLATPIVDATRSPTEFRVVARNASGTTAGADVTELEAGANRCAVG